jgi:hypothetical protein
MQTHETAGPPARERGRHRHDDHRGRMTAMTIDTIKQTDLTVSERQVLDDDRERWRRMGSGAHLDDWLAYGPGLLIRRRLAMRIAYVNRPEGKGYVQRPSRRSNDFFVFPITHFLTCKYFPCFPNSARQALMASTVDIL